ncbi:MAG: DUF503 domain-containing protein [Anaerolineae bacterium]|nr:DUF503 domain-containing protein [Anaerolineae bacterium]
MTIIVGACILELYLPGASSLKEKRSLLKPLLTQLRRRFEVAAAEVDHQDTWQSSSIAIATVANDTRHVYAVLERAAHWVDTDYRAVQVVDWNIELR